MIRIKIKDIPFSLLKTTHNPPELMSRSTTLQMPAVVPMYGETTLPEVTGSVVIIGANGSGKTRLGVWFEFQSAQRQSVRRISAQKSLDFPDNIRPVSLEDAEASLNLGMDPSSFSGNNRQVYLSNIEGNRRSQKWRQKPETALVSDYSFLLTYTRREVTCE